MDEIAFKKQNFESDESGDSEEEEIFFSPDEITRVGEEIKYDEYTCNEYYDKKNNFCCLIKKLQTDSSGNNKFCLNYSDEESTFSNSSDDDVYFLDLENINKKFEPGVFVDDEKNNCFGFGFILSHRYSTPIVERDLLKGRDQKLFDKLKENYNHIYIFPIKIKLSDDPSCQKPYYSVESFDLIYKPPIKAQNIIFYGNSCSTQHISNGEYYTGNEGQCITYEYKSFALFVAE